AGTFAARSLAVRINSRGSPWVNEDLAAIAGAEVRPQSVIVPKVESDEDVVFVEGLLDEVEQTAAHLPRIGLQVLIETPRSLWSLREICAASSRLEALILGYADLSAS